MPKITKRREQSLDERISESARFVERLRQACEATRLQCERQRAMLAAQRRFLVELDERRGAGGPVWPGGRPAPCDDPGGALSDGE